MLIVSYFYSVAFLGFMGTFFNTNNGVNVFMKALSLLFMIAGISAGIPLVNGAEAYSINHMVVILSGVLGITFMFAKGSGMWAILVKLFCLLALISAGIYFSI